MDPTDLSLPGRGAGYSAPSLGTPVLIRWPAQPGSIQCLGLPVPFYRFLGEGSHTKIDYRKMGTLILTSTGGP